MSSFEDKRGWAVAVKIGDWTKLGAAIRDARKGRGLSQHELARQAGVSRSWLARVEAGHRGAELEPLFRLLGALDLTLTLSEGKPAREDAPGDSGQAGMSAAARLQRLRRVAGESALQPRSAQAALETLAKHQSAAIGRRSGWQLAALDLPQEYSSALNQIQQLATKAAREPAELPEAIRKVQALLPEQTPGPGLDYSQALEHLRHLAAQAHPDPEEVTAALLDLAKQHPQARPHPTSGRTESSEPGLRREARRRSDGE